MAAKHGDGTSGERAVEMPGRDRVLWPEEKLTRGDLAAYLDAVAPAMLPHLRDRPLTLRVYPDGIDGESHYRRDLPDDAPDWFRHADYTGGEGRTIQVPLVDDAAGLEWLVGRGTIELHAWSSRAPGLDDPDQAVFDLDPGDAASFADVLAAARALRAELERQGLRGYPKTSGGSGVHVHVPLAPGHGYPRVRAWVKAVAAALAGELPDLVAVARGATHRGELVTVDYAQNSIARTMAAPYTARARPGAPVAAPVTWEEIDAGEIRPADFTIRTIPARLAEIGDPLAPALADRQRLPE